jgi:hypothetical protein
VQEGPGGRLTYSIARSPDGKPTALIVPADGRGWFWLQAEMGRDKKLFCYGAKAHPVLSSGQEVVASYVVNSFDFGQVARQGELYWPRFVRLTLAPSE